MTRLPTQGQTSDGGANMKRREFLTLMGAAASWPLAARAQDADRIYRIGFLLPTPRASPAVNALFDELGRNGFVEGQNLTVIPGGFSVPNDRIDAVAANLVAASPDVVVAGPELPLHALQKLTRTIPLVGMSEDMVAEGLVVSLARPGSNTTGVSLLSPELDGKRQEILIEAVPGMRKIAVLADANNIVPAALQRLQQAAQRQGVDALMRIVNRRDDVIAAIKDAQSSGAQAINFLASPMFSVDAGAFIAQVTNSRLGSIYQWPEDAENGALLGYGPRFTDMYRQRARMAVKVLRGTPPADIPVEQPAKVELVVNLKTAEAIGVDVPSSLVLRADKVIE